MAAVSVPPKQDNHDFSSFYQECDSAPRINELAKWFESAAGEKSGQPIKNPRVDRRYLKPDDDELNRFIDLFEQRPGPFVHHYHASIPCRIEENCRLGHAILKYSKGLPHPLLYCSVGTGDKEAWKLSVS